MLIWIKCFLLQRIFIVMLSSPISTWWSPHWTTWRHGDMWIGNSWVTAEIIVFQCITCGLHCKLFSGCLWTCSRSVSNQKALLDSGTMGTKGHTEIIVPFLTESYNSHVSVYVYVCIYTRCVLVYTSIVHGFFSQLWLCFLERPTGGGDSVLHSKIFSCCYWTHHTVGQRQVGIYFISFYFIESLYPLLLSLPSYLF